MLMRRNTFTLFALTILGMAPGCSSNGGAPLPALPAAAELSETSQPSALQALLTKGKITGTPTEVYTRIARGVLTCWFGAAGPLKSAYIYHAEAEPASKGGRSEIKIMTREADADDPRALRAYGIVIEPGDGAAKVEVENRKLTEPLAQRLTADVERWSTQDDAECGEGPTTAGWAAEPAVDIKAAKKAKAKKP
jgi:hypothetical protein